MGLGASLGEDRLGIIVYNICPKVARWATPPPPHSCMPVDSWPKALCCAPCGSLTSLWDSAKVSAQSQRSHWQAHRKPQHLGGV